MPELLKTILANSSNLKGYWRFESGALTTDTQGTHTLTAIASPAAGTGKFGGGVDLASSAAYSAADNAELKPTGHLSMGGWVKTSNTGAQKGIIQSWHGTNLGGLLLDITSGNVARFAMGSNTGAGAFTDVSSTTNICDGNWHLVIATYDGATARIWIDGKQENGVARASGAAYNATNYVRIGCENNAGTNSAFLTGSLDDMFLINGTALSADQIKELYEGRIYGELRPNQFGTTVGLWHLNGNSTDFSGNNNHGTDTAITYSAANGKFGQGAGFNGSSSSISIADNAAMEVANGTIGFWISPNSTITNTNTTAITFLDKGNTYLGGRFGNADPNKGKMRFILFNGSTNNVYTSQTTWTAGVWYHIAFSWGSGGQKIYVNGNVDGTNANTGGFSNTADVWYLGRQAGASPNYFSGKMDEVFFTSTQLTANQIRQIYAYQKGLLGRYA